MSLETGEANDLSDKAREAANKVVRTKQKEACHKLDELAKKILHDTGTRNTLTAAQGALLSARVAAIDSELGC